jgi:hypothetical protein
VGDINEEWKLQLARMRLSLASSLHERLGNDSLCDVPGDIISCIAEKIEAAVGERPLIGGIDGVLEREDDDSEDDDYEDAFGGGGYAFKYKKKKKSKKIKRKTKRRKTKRRKSKRKKHKSKRYTKRLYNKKRPI